MCIIFLYDVLPPGLEPGITVSKTVVISTSLQERLNFSSINYVSLHNNITDNISLAKSL